MTKHPQSGIAQLLASKGREGDTMLVHMAPSEVAGLQQLARSKGTSLTVNPHTGLPEAKNLLDYLGQGSGYGSNVAGAILGMIGVDPVTSGILVGASQVISSGGDFEKGLRDGMTAGAMNKGVQMLNIPRRIQAFKQGWNAPTTPTIGGSSESMGTGWDKSGNFQPGWDAQGNRIVPSAATTSAMPTVTDPEIMEASGYSLKAPEQVAQTLTKPTTIEATTEGKSYLPKVVTDNPLMRGLKAMGNVAPASQPTGGITSLNADQTAQLKNLNDLKTSGAISDQEFTAAKNNLFNIAAKPSTAEDTEKLMKLATMGITEHRATEQDRKLAAEDAATKAAMTPKPVPYVGGNKVVQVRNPKFGQIGQPMYLQYYAKAGEANAGGVREMTPTELTQYSQSGKFVPGAARGGLTDLLRDRARQRYTSSLNPRVVNAPVGFEQVAAQNPNTYFSTPTQANPVAGNRQYYQDLLDTNLAKKKILMSAGS